MHLQNWFLVQLTLESFDYTIFPVEKQTLSRKTELELEFIEASLSYWLQQ